MGYYCVKGRHELGKEPLGSTGRLVWRDLKTVGGACRRAERTYPGGFTLWAFRNFYDDRTFRLIAQR